MTQACLTVTLTADKTKAGPRTLTIEVVGADGTPIDDAEGRGWVLDYEMIELPEGWRINGVQVLPAPDVAA